MHIDEVASIAKKVKTEKNMTIEEISEKSGVAVRTVNRILAGEDVRYSSLQAFLDVHGLRIEIVKKTK